MDKNGNVIGKKLGKTVILVSRENDGTIVIMTTDSDEVLKVKQPVVFS